MATATKKNRISGNGHANADGVVDPTSAQSAELIVIPKPDFRRFRVTLRGTTSYLMHKFSEKAAETIRQKEQQKAKTARGKRDPHAEYLAACYTLPGYAAGEANCKYGIPTRQIKAAMVAACRFVNDLPMTKARGLVTRISGEDDPNFATLEFDEMRMNEDAIRLPNKALDLRYRPEFIGWRCVITIEYLASVASAAQICNLLQIAGHCCGIGELRPNSTSGPGGANGTFEIESTASE